MTGPSATDPYRILGVRYSADQEQIKQAFRKKARSVHPDVSTDPAATERFRAVHLAYQLLRDPELRRQVDAARTQSRAQEARQKDRRRTYYPDPVFGHTRDIPPTPAQRRAFIGLHLTGFVFGWILVIGIPMGVLLMDWSPYLVLMTVPGLVVIPDSYAGMRRSR